MRNKGLIVVMICGMLLLEGCRGQKMQDEIVIPVAEEETGWEDTAREAEDLGGADAASTKDTVCADDAVVIEMGPEKNLFEEGNMVYTLHDFKLYESPEEASVSFDEMYTIDAQSYLNESKFLTVQVDISNIDYKGSYQDGSINLSLFTIGPQKYKEGDVWSGSLPVYLSEGGKDADFYHVLVKEGETKTITVGFFVPIEDASALCRECKIMIYGCYEEGYMFDIPQIQ